MTAGRPAAAVRCHWSRLNTLAGAVCFALLLFLARESSKQTTMLQLLVAEGRTTRSRAAPGVAGAVLQGNPARPATPISVPNPAKPLPNVNSRDDIPALLQAEGLKTGAELGVLVGAFAEHTLHVWSSCERYYLVDLWGKQENYDDLANVDNDTQEARLQETKQRLKPWEAKTVYLRTYTVEAAKEIPNDSLDYVYIDARHDYCGVKADLDAYWPKLRSGGIMAGHDYMDALAPALKATGQNWSVCLDGTVHVGAVKGAVDEFAAEHGLTISLTS